MEHPFGWLSLLPSLVAVVMAIATRRVVTSMLAAIFVGALITNHGNFFSALSEALEIHVWKTFAGEDRLRVFTFTIFMGAMIGVIRRSGGMLGLINVISIWAKNRRRGQVVTWLLGMLVFFDDYANTVLLGSTLQPLCKRLKISKEKLAYLVDSTAAPVAGLALISTWVAGEISFIEDGLKTLPTDEEVSAFQLFVSSLPYRFYAVWCLIFVLLVGLMRRDYGPMVKVERIAAAGLEPDTIQSANQVSDDDVSPSGWWNAIIPVAVTVAGVLWLLTLTGKQNLAADPIDVNTAKLREIFGAADSYYALLWGTALGLAVSFLLAISQRLLNWKESCDAAAQGAKLMLPAIAVLGLASTLSAMTGNKDINGDTGEPFKISYRLYTGEFLASLVPEESEESDALLRVLLPSLVFVLAGGISFATGTSWGTMAIVMPVAIPLTYPVIASDPNWASSPILICTIGSVLAGSIFGDHCSPISDTTVLSSQACGCEHTAHVWTQLPYALTVGLITVVLGTLPIGLGVSVWLLLPLGVVAMILTLLFFGKEVSVEPNENAEG